MKPKKKSSLTMNFITCMTNSPCLDCMVVSTCTKSFVDNTACEKLLNFIETLLKAAGMPDKTKSSCHTNRNQID